MRYIDADALIKKIYPMGIGDGKYTINAKAVKLAIDNIPTADVVPKSEIENFNKSKGGFCPLCGSYTITQEIMEELRMEHKEQGQHGDPVGADGVEGEDGRGGT